MLIKVGAFFIGATILFFAAILTIREVSFFKGMYIVKVKFHFVEGLKNASPVRFVGVNVGGVDKIEIKTERGIPVVYVYAKVENGIHIPKGSKFFINSLSLLGEKYLEILPPARPVSVYVKEDEVVRGTDPPALFNVTNLTYKTMLKLSNFIDKGEKIRSLVEKDLSGINYLTLDIRGFFGDMRKNRGTIGRLLYDDTLYKNMNLLMKDLKEHPWKLLYKPREKKKRKR